MAKRNWTASLLAALAAAGAVGILPAEPPEPAEPKMELRTYDVRDLVWPVQNYPYSSRIRAASQLGQSSYEWRYLGQGTVELFGSSRSEGSPRQRALREEESLTLVPSDELQSLLKSLVAPDTWPDTWSEWGGMMEELRGMLIIRQTPDNHKKIETLLAELRKALAPRPLTVHVCWLTLSEANARGRISSPDALRELDLNALLGAGSKIVFLGEASCLDGQRFTISSGRGQTVVVGQEPVVSDYAVAYDPVEEFVHWGAILEARPLLVGDGRMVQLDLHSVVTDPISVDHSQMTGTVEKPVFAATQPVASSSELRALALDRLLFRVQTLNTTVQLPVGKLVLVGGMTADQAGSDQRLYLAVRVEAAPAPAAKR